MGDPIREPLRIRLTIDDGLAPYLRALVNSPVGIFGNEHETIIYFVRSALIDMMTPGNGFRESIIDHLPDDLKRRWRPSPSPMDSGGG